MHDTSYMTNYHVVLAIVLTAISSWIQSLILLASRDINIAFVPQEFAFMLSSLEIDFSIQNNPLGSRRWLYKTEIIEPLENLSFSNYILSSSDYT
jgi:hypothetical protein